VEVRAVDRRAFEVYGIPTLLLMENAGASLARFALERAGTGLTLVVCGRGGNGGDGLVLARHLAVAERPVIVALAAEPDSFDRKSDAGENLTIVEKMKLPLEVAKDAAALRALLARAKPSLLADALFGTGLTEAPREPHRGLIEAMNSSGVPILAVDLPSGLDCDAGRPLGACVRASWTVTFAAPKKGFEHAREWTGPVSVVPIGCPLA